MHFLLSGDQLLAFLSHKPDRPKLLFLRLPGCPACVHLFPAYEASVRKRDVDAAVMNHSAFLALSPAMEQFFPETLQTKERNKSGMFYPQILAYRRASSMFEIVQFTYSDVGQTQSLDSAFDSIGILPRQHDEKSAGSVQETKTAGSAKLSVQPALTLPDMRPGSWIPCSKASKLPPGLVRR